MRKLSGFMFVPISIILIMALVLSSCSSGSSPTSAPLTSNAPQTTSSTQPTNTAPPVSSSVQPSSATASSEPIKIGLMSSLSGFFASLAPYMTTGAQMVVDNINASGGLLGRQVQLITRDDLADPSQVPQAAAALKSAGVVGIVGTFLDSADSALIQWCDTNHVIQSSPCNTTIATRTTEFSKYSFFQSPISSADGKVLAQNIAKESDVNSIYFLGADVLLSHDVQNSFWAEMKQLKPSVVDLGTTYVSSTETDFTNTINAVLAKKPDMVLMSVAGPAWPNFVQQAKAFNFFDKTKVASLLILSAEGTVGFGKNYPVGLQSITTAPFWLDTPEMKTFTQDFYSRTKLYPSELTMDYYIATLALCKAIQKAGTTDTNQVISAFENLTINNTPLGTISYNDYDHQADTPLWYGTSGYSPDYPIAIGLNLVKYQDNIYPTRDEILALRAAK